MLDALLRAAADGGRDPFRAPELAFLRALHARTGATCDLYLFAESGAGRIEEVPDRFAPALAREASWLRFGFHGRNAAASYGAGGVSAEEARRDHDRVRAQARRFAGPEGWTRTVRTHRFQGRADVVRAWRDAPDGPSRLLTPDDDRDEAYALPPAARTALRATGAWADPHDGMRYAASLPRLESDPDPVRTAAAALVRRRAAGGPARICAFTHEPFLRSAEVRARLEALARWAAATGVRFGAEEDVAGPAPVAPRDDAPLDDAARASSVQAPDPPDPSEPDDSAS